MSKWKIEATAKKKRGGRLLVTPAQFAKDLSWAKFVTPENEMVIEISAESGLRTATGADRGGTVGEVKFPAHITHLTECYNSSKHCRRIKKEMFWCGASSYCLLMHTNSFQNYHAHTIPLYHGGDL